MFFVFIFFPKHPISYSLISFDYQNINHLHLRVLFVNFCLSFYHVVLISVSVMLNFLISYFESEFRNSAFGIWFLYTLYVVTQFLNSAVMLYLFILHSWHSSVISHLLSCFLYLFLVRLVGVFFTLYFVTLFSTDLLCWIALYCTLRSSGNPHMVFLYMVFRDTVLDCYCVFVYS